MAMTKTRRTPGSKPALPTPKKRPQPKMTRRTITPKHEAAAAAAAPAVATSASPAATTPAAPTADAALPAKRVLATENGQASDKSPKRMRWCDIIEARTLLNGVEDDKHRIAQRRKQIDFGKNTVAYDRFSKSCPRHLREKGDPMTPIIHQKCSKRSFVGQINCWKRGVYAEAAKLENPDDAISNEEMAKILSQTIKPLTQMQKKHNKVNGKDELVKRPTREAAAKPNPSKKPMDTKSSEAEQSSSDDDSDFKGGSSPDSTSDEGSQSDCDDNMDIDVYGNAGDLDDVELDDQGNPIES